MSRLLLALAAVLAMTLTAPAQADQLTLARVFGNPDLAGSQPRLLRLSPDGQLLTSLKPRPDEKERFDLWALDTGTGREWMLVDSKKLGTGAELSEAEKMQRERDRAVVGKSGIVAYEWSHDGRSILVPLDGDLYLASLDGSVRRLTDTPGGELNPTISPRGAFLSFVRDGNLFVQPLAGDTATRLTGDGGGTVHWGEAEFVAQEEMHRFTGHWWSPDERFLAVERFDDAPVGIVSRAAIGADGTRMFEQRYPRAGTPNALVELYVMRPDGSGRVKVDLGPNPDIYLARVHWSPDGPTLYVERQSRDQKALDLLVVDPLTGASRVLFTERSGPRSWINLHESFRALSDGSLIWRSERDGFGHLYRYANGQWTQLTSGQWSVAGLVGLDEAGGRLWFLGNKDDVLEQHLYTVQLASPGEVTRLTEPGWWNAATMDGAASRLIVTRSNPGQPPQTYLADTSGNRLRWLNENAVTARDHPYHPYLAQHRPTTNGTIRAADGSALHWEMITPRMVPGRRYPVFFWHYGGPGTGQEVRRSWGGALRQYLVSRGWIFFQIDNRGSLGRGKAFEDQLYHAMGTVEVEDQLAGLRFLKSLGHVDPARIATYGWSYGGYLTLKLLEKAPGQFAAGVAGAPVTRWELYDTHYTERYLGDPKVDSYTPSNAILEAPAIRDPLLLIHGMADDNVLFDHSTALMARMQSANRPFELMAYPGQTHRVGGPGVSEHLWTTILDFLDRKVGPVRR